MHGLAAGRSADGVHGIPAGVVGRLGRATWLERPSLGVALLAVAVLLGVASWRAYRRGAATPRRRRLRLLSGAAATVLACCLSALVFLNAAIGYAPDLTAVASLLGLTPAVTVSGAAARSGTGAVRVVRIGDPRLGVPAAATYVYTPPGYATHQKDRYPTVYLLHGYPGWSPDWFRAGRVDDALDALIGARAVPPMIVVAPDANGGFLHDSECLNAPPGGPQIGTYLTRDVVRYVDRHFRTIRSRAARGVGGMSSGGFCALNLGLRHRSEFSVILALEPYGIPGHRADVQVLHDDSRLLRENSPSLYLPRLRFRRPVAVFLDVGGAEASGVRRVERLAAQLRARHLPVLFRVEEGQGHNWLEARAGIPYALVFAAQHLQQPQATSAAAGISRRTVTAS